jgi:hypothetical protein
MTRLSPAGLIAKRGNARAGTMCVHSPKPPSLADRHCSARAYKASSCRSNVSK